MPDILELAEQLVDNQVGVIRYVQEVRTESGGPTFVYYLAETCNITAMNSQFTHGTMFGAGVATNRRRALGKALGEGVERYSGTIYFAEDFPLATYESATFPCVPPEAFTLFSEEQYAAPDFPFTPFDRTTPVRWVPAMDLFSGVTTHVPAAKVFLPYVGTPESGEPMITPPISTGFACHSNHAQAALSAICEVIEREAVVITWQARLPRRQIRLETLSPQNQDLVDRLRRTGASVFLLHLAMDHGIPAILAVIKHSFPDAPAVLIAAAAHPNPEQTVQKGLEELAQIWHVAEQTKQRLPKFSANPPWKDLMTGESHATPYFYHANTHLTDFLFDSQESIAFSEIANLSTGDLTQDLRVVVERVHAVGSRVLLADATSEDVGDLGLFVLRAIIPDFHPLFMGHRIRALGGRRLWELPQRLGYPGLTREQGDNPSPHPFA